MEFENIRVEVVPPVRVITLNRPEVKNALNTALMKELAAALQQASADESIAAVVITGSGEAFAAGVDIREMAERTFAEAYSENMISGEWEAVANCPKPTIAAVSGYALGGGCELALMCDIVIAAENAQFGQPEVSLGIPPGLGGTQRLVRAIGKAKAMEMCLSGRLMSAVDAERSGLVARIVPVEALIEEAVALVKQIAERAPLAVAMAREAINASYEMSLAQGVRYEKRLFHASFATHDQKEGMQAFIEKRSAKFIRG